MVNMQTTNSESQSVTYDGVRIWSMEIILY